MKQLFILLHVLVEKHKQMMDVMNNYVNWIEM